MAKLFDLILRGGTVVDGSGGKPFTGDVAITGDRIVAVGTVEGTGRATENCDNPDASFYPKAGDIAELHRCAPKPEPSV